MANSRAIIKESKPINMVRDAVIQVVEKPLSIYVRKSFHLIYLAFEKTRNTGKRARVKETPDKTKSFFWFSSLIFYCFFPNNCLYACVISFAISLYLSGLSRMVWACSQICARDVKQHNKSLSKGNPESL